MAPWALVSPANRGIGLTLTRHLLRTTTLPIVATTRGKFDGARKSILEDLKDVDESRLNILNINFLDENTIEKAAEEAKKLFPPKENHLHLGFCIPGILFPERSPTKIQQRKIMHSFGVNTIGPMLMFKHFCEFLPKKSTDISLPSPPSDSDFTLPQQAVWLNMSARVGSTTDNKLGGWYSYRASKAAVNSVTKGEDIWLEARSGEKAMAMSYHPGTVRTGLSESFWDSVKQGQLFSPEFAVEKMVGVVGRVGLEGRGRCWDWRGEAVPP